MREGEISQKALPENDEQWDQIGNITRVKNA